MRKTTNLKFCYSFVELCGIPGCQFLGLNESGIWSNKTLVWGPIQIDCFSEIDFISFCARLIIEYRHVLKNFVLLKNQFKGAILAARPNEYEKSMHLYN